MRRVTSYISVLIILTGVVSAQDKAGTSTASQLESHMTVGAEVEGIRTPIYDKKTGELKAQVYGGYAKILEGGLADITNLRLDVYDGGKIVMTVFAPQCYSRMVQGGGSEESNLEAYSDGEVLIEMDEITIFGRGFRFLSENNRFEILSESRVLVKESARAIREQSR